MIGPFSVTFDSNLIEVVLDENGAREKGVVEMFEAIKNQRITAFVAQAYFAHDAIRRSLRVETLRDGIEITIPRNPLLQRLGVGLRFDQTAIANLNEHNLRTLKLMREFGVRVLAFSRKYWPKLELDLPMAYPPVGYEDRTLKIRNYIESELHCGFAYFRDFLKTTTGMEGDDFVQLWRLKETQFSARKFNLAFAEAGDGDALIAHYGYGMQFFCTNDEAAKIGEQSIFSKSNRQKLKRQFGVEIISPKELVAKLKECEALNEQGRQYGG